MSVSEDLELKELMVQTLANNGCLAKIKAQLRASVFLALEEDIKVNSKQPLMNNKVKSYLDSLQGQLMFCLVKEFLEFFNLDSTVAVFDAETYSGLSYEYIGRTGMLENLGINDDNTSAPLLQHIIQLAQQNLIKNEEYLNFDHLSTSDQSLKTECIMGEEYNIDESSNTMLERIQLPDSNDSNLNDVSYYHNENSLNLNNTFTKSSPMSNLESNKTNTNNIDVMYPLESNNNSKNNEEDGLNHTRSQISNFTSVVAEISSTSPHISLSLSLSEKIDEVTVPVLKDMKVSPERLKSPPKTEKFKTKNSLNSFSELPPLNMNKNRSGTILPSLYSREFRDKPNS